MYLLDTEVNPTSRPYRSRPQKPLLLLQDFLRRNRKVIQSGRKCRIQRVQQANIQG